MLVARLRAAGEPGLAVCGGASIYDQFIRAGVITDVYLTVAPLFFGTGVPLFGGTLDVRLALADTRLLNDHTILLHYNVLQKA